MCVTSGTRLSRHPCRVREGCGLGCVGPRAVPFALPGARSEPPDELKDEEEERQLDIRRDMRGRIEDQARKAGVDKVLFARPSYIVHSLRS